jgi:CubicO group peptidase (beta-lactamase class C family)
VVAFQDWSREGVGVDVTSLHAAVAAVVEDGLVPGAVFGVSGPDGTRVDAVGTATPGGRPLRPDAVVRLSSMTKPIVAVLALTLARDGLLALDAPVTRWLPELDGQRVVRRVDGPADDTVPVERAPTVEDLLTMRLGHGFPVDVDACPAFELAGAAGLGIGPPFPTAISHDPDTWIARFAGLPLLDQPGQVWRYDTAAMVLGVLLARAGGASLPELLADRVLDPLGMADTGFTVPDGARDRLVPLLGTDGAVVDPAEGSQWLTRPAFPNAAGGLVSTAADVLRFGRFLLADGEDLLPTELVRAMTTDATTDRQRRHPAAAPFLGGHGWGYGLQVVHAAPRRVGWGGGLGTTWWAYPDDGVTAVLLTQVVPPSAEVIDPFWDALAGRLAGSPAR